LTTAKQKGMASLLDSLFQKNEPFLYALLPV
jgi:hypothetical protein